MMIPEGNWQGTVRVWFEPTSDAIVSDITATTSRVLGGKLVRIDYQSMVNDKRSDGEMIVGNDMSTNKPAIVWIDTYHTGGTLGLFAGQDDGSFLGSYPAGDQVWHWRIRVHEGDELRIEHFNIMPGEEEYLGVEVTLKATPAAS